MGKHLEPFAVPADDVGVVAGAGRVPPFVRFSAQQRRCLYRSAARYGEHPAQLLDVWRRPDLPPGPAPVLLFVPGGAWVPGTRVLQGHTLLSHLVKQGWVCLTMDYRFRGELTEDADTSVDAVVGIYGRYDWQDRSTATRRNFQAFLAALRAVSRKPVEYCEIPRAGHAFDLVDTSHARRCAAEVARFLTDTRNRHVAGCAVAAV